MPLILLALLVFVLVIGPALAAASRDDARMLPPAPRDDDAHL